MREHYRSKACYQQQLNFHVILGSVTQTAVLLNEAGLEGYVRADADVLSTHLCCSAFPKELDLVEDYEE